MKTTKYRKVLTLGGILMATLAVGCFGNGQGSSNSPYGYNGSFYTSRPYDGGYGNPSPYNSGYNDTHSFPQSFGNSNSYSAGLQHGVRVEASRDDQDLHVSDRHVPNATKQARDQTQNERQPSSVERDKNSKND